MRRPSLTFLALVAGLGALALLRRRSSRVGRVDIYRADGSMISLDRSDPRAERMLALAGAAIRAVRTC